MENGKFLVLSNGKVVLGLPQDDTALSGFLVDLAYIDQ